MDIKIISKRYKNKGKMFHYSHFIRDFLLPFFNFRLYFQNDINRVLLNSAKSQSIGTFVDKAIRFFNLPFQVVTEQHFANSKALPVTLHCLKLNPISNFVYQKLLRYVEEKYDLDPRQPPTYVTIIKRGQDSLAFGDSNGARRRHIVNHDEITKAFRNVDGFQTVVMEGMPFEQQIKLFYHSKVIIAQHGAALCNTIFSRNATVFEIVHAHKSEKHWYEPISEYKEDLNWNQLVFPGRFNRLYVPPIKMLNLVRPYL